MSISSFLNRKKAVGLLAVLLIAGLCWWLWPADNDAPVANTATATVGNIENVVTAVGNLQPLSYVDVGAQVSGILQALHVEIGDQVKEGDLLAEIDASVQQANVDASYSQLDSQKAQMNEKKVQLELARIQFEREKRLRSDGATSEDSYESARASYLALEAQIKSLEAQIAQNQASLKAAEATLSYAKIYAPMSGTVVSLDALQGQTLNANQTAPILMRIADLSTMTVWTEVSEADVPRLRVGMAAYFSPLGMTRQTWHGTLRQILPTPSVVNNVVLYTALFDVDNSDGRLMTQMTAQVFFVLSQAKDVVTVPMSALKRRRGPEDEVTVLLPDGRQEVRAVQVGINDRINVEIREGLEAGETVVLDTAPSAPPAMSGNGRNNNNQNRQPGPPMGGPF